jgi:hypothetical protein
MHPVARVSINKYRMFTQTKLRVNLCLFTRCHLGDEASKDDGKGHDKYIPNFCLCWVPRNKISNTLLMFHFSIPYSLIAMTAQIMKLLAIPITPLYCHSCFVCLRSIFHSSVKSPRVTLFPQDDRTSLHPYRITDEVL